MNPYHHTIPSINTNIQNSNIGTVHGDVHNHIHGPLEWAAGQGTSNGDQSNTGRAYARSPGVNAETQGNVQGGASGGSFNAGDTSESNAQVSASDNGDADLANAEASNADEMKKPMKKREKGSNVKRPKKKKPNIISDPEFIDGILILPDNIVPTHIDHIDDEHVWEWREFYPLLKRAGDGCILSTDDPRYIDDFKKLLKKLHKDITAIGNEAFKDYACGMLNAYLEKELPDYHQTIAKITTFSALERFLRQVDSATRDADPLFCMKMNINCIHQANQEAGPFVRSFLVDRLNQKFAEKDRSHRPFHIRNTVSDPKKSRNHSIVTIANFGASEAKRKNVDTIEERVLNMKYRASLQRRAPEDRVMIPCEELSLGFGKAYISIKKTYLPYWLQDREEPPTLDELVTVLKNGIGSGRNGIMIPQKATQKGRMLSDASKEEKLVHAIRAYASVGFSDAAVVDKLIQGLSLQRGNVPNIIDALKQCSDDDLMMSSDLEAVIELEFDQRASSMMSNDELRKMEIDNATASGKRNPYKDDDIFKDGLTFTHNDPSEMFINNATVTDKNNDNKTETSNHSSPVQTQKARTTLSSIFHQGIVDTANSKEEMDGDADKEKGTNDKESTQEERRDNDADKEKGTDDKESTQEERRDNDLSEKSKASFVFHHIMLSLLTPCSPIST